LWLPVMTTTWSFFLTCVLTRLAMLIPFRKLML